MVSGTPRSTGLLPLVELSEDDDDYFLACGNNLTLFLAFDDEDEEIINRMLFNSNVVLFLSTNKLCNFRSTF